MYTVGITIKDLAGTSNQGFERATNIFLENLTSISGLDVDMPKRKIEGTRGDISLITGIIVTGINLGLFSGIYTLAKDLYGWYANAEVELQFEDGSKLTLKHLSYEEAEKIINEHLKKTTNLK